jgi:GT2 family glycosyltransferase
MSDKKVRSNENRRSMQDKLRAALDKKPTISHLNAKGIPTETLNKQLSNIPEDKQRLVQRHVRNKNQKRFQNRPKTVRTSSIRREPFTAPIARVVPTPDWFANDKPVDVSIIIPMYRSKEYIEEQIRRWPIDDDGLTKEIIYVDDSCPDRTHRFIVDAWEKRKDELQAPIGKIVMHNRNGGFASACNSGANEAQGTHLIFLNADTVVHPNWIKPMYDLYKDETMGIVGNLHLKMGSTKIDSLGSEWDWGQKSFLHIGRHIYKKRTINEPFRLENVPKELMQVRDVEMVTGACFMIPLKIFNEIGGFDTEYRVGYWEDSDLCMKTHMHGYRVVCQPASVIEHKVGHSAVGYHGHMTENQKVFQRKWIDTKIMDGFVNGPLNKKHIKVNSESIVVYTAITGGYDTLREQRPSARNSVKFIAFTDEPHESKTWEVREAHKEFSDPNRNAKIHKVLPHLYFPDHAYSLWIDGSVGIQFPFGVDRLAEVYLADHDMAIFKHPDRNCLYQEANTCINRNLDDKDLIRQQIQRYTKEGYPPNAGLVEATIILRRHTPKIIEFNEAWWNEIQNGSKRDQISFNYVARKVGIKWRYFPGDLRTPNSLFQVNSHKKKR